MIRKRRQVRVLELAITDLVIGAKNACEVNPEFVPMFSMKKLKARKALTMSQSHILDKVEEMEKVAYLPAMRSIQLEQARLSADKVNGKSCVAVRGNVVKATRNALRRADLNRVNREMYRPLETMISFSFSTRDTQDADFQEIILNVLEKGAYCEETGKTFFRTFRSPSHFRAGGAWLSTFPGDYRNIFSFGFEHKEGYTDFETVTSKWESQLALSLTNSLPVSMGKMPNICVVEDIVREVSVNAEMVAEDPTGNSNQTTFECFDKHVVRANGSADDFTFDIVSGTTLKKLELTDGYCLITRELMAYIREMVMLACTDEEEAYLNSVQFRMPYMKGMCVEFSIQEYCQEKGINTIRDIYGKEWNVADIDMIVPESVFKGADMFKDNGIHGNGIRGYVDTCLNGTFEFLGKTFNHFENYNFFRIVNINKPKKEKNAMTYQYIQSLSMLSTESAKEFTNVIFDHAKHCLTDINHARALSGMLGVEQDDFNRNMVSKLQYILDLKPSLFDTSFVQKRILKLVEKMVDDQCTGRIYVNGAYHFIISDPTLFFTGAVDGVLDGKDRPVLSSHEEAGIIPTGYTFQAGEEHDAVAALFRSPLVHENESAVVMFYRDEEVDRWLGHLKGIICFNGYEATALGMGGASL